jgi:hypothetical protein|nr:MAG TPA: hypothetical protein [Caudoviricetes sp.]
MSAIFITLGILFFVMTLYTVYTQGKQIEQLKKVVRRQRDLLESASTPLPQDPDRAKQRFDESWAEVENLFRHNSTMK